MNPSTDWGAAAGPSAGIVRVSLIRMQNQAFFVRLQTFAVELGSEELGAPQVRLKIDGSTVPGASMQWIDGERPVVRWETQYIPSGTYGVYLECDFSGGNTTVYGRTNLVTVDNYLRLDLNLGSFGNQMWVYGEAASGPVDYEIDLYDATSDEYLRECHST